MEENEKLAKTWEEKKSDYCDNIKNEELLKETWEHGEDQIFLYVMFLATL